MARKWIFRLEGKITLQMEHFKAGIMRDSAFDDAFMIFSLNDRKSLCAGRLSVPPPDLPQDKDAYYQMRICVGL
jgi:hypothetical protein